VAVACNLVVIAEAAHALLRPRIAISGRDADSIEQACNLAVRHQSSQLAHERDRVVRNARVVPTGCIEPLLHLQLSMVTALPMRDCMNDRAVAAHNDLRDRSAQNTLARCSCRGGMRPGAFEIGTERHESLPLWLTKRRRTPRDHSRDDALVLGNRLQSLVPSTLHLAGDDPIGWINIILLSCRHDALIPGRLQTQYQLSVYR